MEGGEGMGGQGGGGKSVMILVRGLDSALTGAWLGLRSLRSRRMAGIWRSGARCMGTRSGASRSEVNRELALRLTLNVA